MSICVNVVTNDAVAKYCFCLSRIILTQSSEKEADAFIQRLFTDVKHEPVTLFSSYLLKPLNFDHLTYFKVVKVEKVKVSIVDWCAFEILI